MGSLYYPKLTPRIAKLLILLAPITHVSGLKKQQSDGAPHATPGRKTPPPTRHKEAKGNLE
jgi:hypothetical protein